MKTNRVVLPKSNGLMLATIFAIMFALSASLVSGCGGSKKPDENAQPVTRAEVDSLPPQSFNTVSQSFNAVLERNPSLINDNVRLGRAVLNEIKKTTVVAASSRQEEPVRNIAFLFGASMIQYNELYAILEQANAWGAGLLAAATAPESSLAAVPCQSAKADGTRQNAIQHAYWNALFAKRIRFLDIVKTPQEAAFLAKQYTDLWEERNTGAPGPRSKAMDYNNNAIGRDVYVRNPTTSDEELLNAIASIGFVAADGSLPSGNGKLVYLRGTDGCGDLPKIRIRVLDSGPDLDDVFQVSWDNESLGATPKGGEAYFVPQKEAWFGNHTLTIRCTVDGTKGGGGFRAEIQGAVSTGDTTVSGSDLSEGENREYTVVVTRNSRSVVIKPTAQRTRSFVGSN